MRLCVFPRGDLQAELQGQHFLGLPVHCGHLGSASLSGERWHPVLLWMDHRCAAISILSALGAAGKCLERSVPPEPGPLYHEGTSITPGSCTNTFVFHVCLNKTTCWKALIGSMKEKTESRRQDLTTSQGRDCREPDSGPNTAPFLHGGHTTLSTRNDGSQITEIEKSLEQNLVDGQMMSSATLEI